MSGGRH